MSDIRKRARDSLQYKPTPEEITQAHSHMFEYHIFCGGVTHRIGRVRHEDAYPMVGQWVQDSWEEADTEEPAWSTNAIHVFQDGRLFTVLELLEFSTAPTLGDGQQWQAAFDEVSILFGVVAEPVKEPVPRVFTWGR